MMIKAATTFDVCSTLLCSKLQARCANGAPTGPRGDSVISDIDPGKAQSGNYQYTSGHTGTGSHGDDGNYEDPTHNEDYANEGRAEDDGAGYTDYRPSTGSRSGGKSKETQKGPRGQKYSQYHDGDYDGKESSALPGEPVSNKVAVEEESKPTTSYDQQSHSSNRKGKGKDTERYSSKHSSSSRRPDHSSNDPAGGSRQGRDNGPPDPYFYPASPGGSQDAEGKISNHARV